MPKPKTQTLPGMEQVTYSVLDEIADRLNEAQTEWQRWQKLQMAERELLKLKMQEYGIHFYKLKDGKIAVLDAGEPKAYLRKSKDFEDDEAENSEPTASQQVTIIRKNQPEPNEDSEATNVLTFFNNNEASAEVAEAISEAETDDDFTADQCSECKSIDGAHSIGCSRASGLTMENYVDYAKFCGVKSANSWARKWSLNHEKDGLIKAWLAEGAEKAIQRIGKRSTKSTPKPTATKQQNSRSRK